MRVLLLVLIYSSSGIHEPSRVLTQLSHNRSVRVRDISDRCHVILTGDVRIVILSASISFLLLCRDTSFPDGQHHVERLIERTCQRRYHLSRCIAKQRQRGAYATWARRNQPNRKGIYPVSIKSIFRTQSRKLFIESLQCRGMQKQLHENPTGQQFYYLISLSNTH